MRKLQKRYLVIDTETGEEKVEFRGVQVLVFVILIFFVIIVIIIVIVIVQVPAQGLGLSHLWRGQR